MVFIAILSAGIVASLCGRRHSYELRVTTNDLAAAIRFACSEARLRHRPHRVAFEETGRSYRVEAAAACPPDLFKPVKGMAGKPRIIADDVRISVVRPGHTQKEPLPESLIFGAEEPDFCGRVHLESVTGELAQIEVAPVTGQVHVFESLVQ